MKLEPVEDDILFEFHDHVNSAGYFREKTKSGIILAQSQLTAARDSANAKIAKVIAVGPKCTQAKPGDDILIEPFKWTPQFEFNGKQMWKTKEPFIFGFVDLSE